MLQDKLEPQRDLDIKEVMMLAKELFFSVRDVNRRLDELLLMRENEFCCGNVDEYVVDRIKKLKETKFKLIFSLQDIRIPLIKALSFLSTNDKHDLSIETEFELLYSQINSNRSKFFLMLRNRNSCKFIVFLICV